MDEIINKVANSVLVVFDLEDYYQNGVRTQIDLSQWLLEGFLLREKDFRATLLEHNWSQYQDHYVAISCSTDAIVPAWASLLVAMHLAPFAKKIVSGSLEDLETSIYQDILSTLDYTVYQDKPLIIKGCSKKPVPMSAYLFVAKFLQPYARSIMYGEACSAVPLYKAKKSSI
ncbi:DUF2480 family protein [Flavobacterium sp.]|jgi:hypothetical protein|uniref:DUF2480 family protein n=1 Tax=Flavobacterium sp. TaxID=239 RepID=UPI0037C181AC